MMRCLVRCFALGLAWGGALAAAGSAPPAPTAERGPPKLGTPAPGFSRLNPTAAPLAIAPTVTAQTATAGGTYFGHPPDPAHTRHYYIAAEPVLWDFTPEGEDPVCGKPLPATIVLNRVDWKIRYVQYADPEFTARILPDPRLGILGPVLRGLPGDYIEVTFLNRAWLPLSMHPHGLKYDKASEGSYYKPDPGAGAAVAPGARFNYVWYVDPAAAPRPDEPSSKAWLYHSHVSGDEEANLGLIGFIVVTDPARARPDGTPRDVDREMGLLFKIFDESNPNATAGEEADERPANAGPTGPVRRTWAELQQLLQDGQRHTINGLAYGNLPGLEMNEGERVRWYVFGLGSENDFHTAHWHGLRVVEDGRRSTDVIELLPGSMRVADLVADNPGRWLLHCHVAEHMENGMFASVVVRPAGGVPVSRAPRDAFFGLPESFQTLVLTTAEFTAKSAAAPAGEVFLEGQVTVPDPLPVVHNPVAIKLGGRAAVFQPDASGIGASPEGLLLVKNISPYGNGIVRGGRMNFEVSLKGAAWLDALRQAKVLEGDRLAARASLPVEIAVGPARHSASATLVPAGAP